METKNDILPGLVAAVAGFGSSGQAIVRYLKNCGAKILVSDIRVLSELSEDERELLRLCGAEYEGGRHTAEFLNNAELIVVSPGVPLDHPALVEAAASGKPVCGELALAAGHFESPVIAITGTNGKTTVTELVGALLAADGKRVFVGGNIGTPVGEYLLAPGGYDAVVLEVSSFQLELCGDFAPDVAVLLNITPDHLDRHGTIERYAEVKMKIFSAATPSATAVMNGDDQLSSAFRHLAGRKNIARFGRKPNYEASVEQGRVILALGTEPQVFDLSGSSLATLTGCLNSAAALLAVQPFDVDPDRALETLRSFRPGGHRMQLVAEIAGVDYINDSKATNTGAVNSALEEIGGRIVLIAGGRDKGDDYRLMREAVARYVKKLVLIGEAAPKLSEALSDLVVVELAKNLEEAVRRAALMAEFGDTVLLSPACASFDMFRSYKHRGESFVAAVEKLNGAMSGQERA